MKSTKRIFALLVCLLISIQAALAAVPAELDQQKLTVAKHLTDWMQKSLLEKHAIVAVVSRKGGKDVKGRDQTGMAHSGLAVYDPRVETWILYQIMNVPTYGKPTAELWRSAPVDFFYGQTGYEEDALIMIPDEETQRRVYRSIVDRRAFKLAFTSDYNLISEYDSYSSLNCNKWILMTLAAARSDEYNPYKVLGIIHSGFEPGKLRLNFVQKAFVRNKSNVRSDEMPTFGSVKTVTPQSLYESGMFPYRAFASGRFM